MLLSPQLQVIYAPINAKTGETLAFLSRMPSLTSIGGHLKLTGSDVITQDASPPDLSKLERLDLKGDVDLALFEALAGMDLSSLSSLRIESADLSWQSEEVFRRILTNLSSVLQSISSHLRSFSTALELSSPQPTWLMFPPEDFLSRMPLLRNLELLDVSDELRVRARYGTSPSVQTLAADFDFLALRNFPVMFTPNVLHAIRLVGPIPLCHTPHICDGRDMRRA